MNKANADIRQYAKDRGVYLWEVAHKVGINDGNFARKLRTELPRQEKDRLKRFIREIAAEHKE